MNALVALWFARLADWRAAALPGALLALLALVGAATGWDPLSSDAWLGLAVLASLALVAGAAQALFDRAATSAIARAGGALALGGLVLHVTSGPLGSVELASGEAVETWRPRTPAGGRRHLGFWLEDLRWQPGERAGSLTVRHVGREPRALPLVPGRPMLVDDVRLVPIAHAAHDLPASAHLLWQDREDGTSGEVDAAVGQTMPAGRGELSLLEARADLNGQGPALHVETRLGEGPPDRRWLFVSSPDHDLASRRAPLAVTVRSVTPSSRVRLAVNPRRPADLAWLGLSLIAAATALAPARRRPR